MSAAGGTARRPFRARKRLDRVQIRIQIFQQALPGILLKRQAVHKQQIRAISVQHVHQEPLLRLLAVKRVIIDIFDLIFRVHQREIPDRHGQNAAPAARDADDPFFCEGLLRLHQPKKPLPAFICSGSILKAKILAIYNAAERFHVHGV